MFDSITLIGAGRIAHILLGGWQAAGKVLPPVRVFDSSAEALGRLQAAFAAVEPVTLAEASRSELLLLGVHPPVLAELLPELAPGLRPEALICSLAPKWRLPQLQAALGGFANLARMNPNATSLVGKGFNPVAYGAAVSPAQRQALQDLFAPLGAMPEVADEQIESYAVISAMAPTYFWFQFTALQQLAESFGLETEAASEAISTMLHGAVDTLFTSGLTPRQVMDLLPVHPLGQAEEPIRELLESAVRQMHQKLQG